jgi:hypothetical protein
MRQPTRIVPIGLHDHRLEGRFDVGGSRSGSTRSATSNSFSFCQCLVIQVVFASP